MRKIILILVACIFIGAMSYGQDMTATLSIGKVSIKDLKVGDEIAVPVYLDEKSEGLLLAFQLFVNFDHEVLSWPADWKQPMTGARNFHEVISFDKDGWLLNDNGNQFVALWNDPDLVGLEIPGGIRLFEMILKIEKEIPEGTVIPLTWGTTYEIVEERLVRGPTEVYDGEGLLYELVLKDGELRK